MSLGEPEARKFADRWLAAWTGNDPNGLLRFYAHDAFYRDPGRPQGIRGHDLLLPYFLRLLSGNPNWKWTATEVLPFANSMRPGFALKWRAEIPVPARTTVVEEGLDIVEVSSGGLITRNEVYFDRVQWLKVLGKT